MLRAPALAAALRMGRRTWARQQAQAQAEVAPGARVDEHRSLGRAAPAGAHQARAARAAAACGPPPSCPSTRPSSPGRSAWRCRPSPARRCSASPRRPAAALLAAARRDLRRAGGGRATIDRRPAAEAVSPRSACTTTTCSPPSPPRRPRPTSAAPPNGCSPPSPSQKVNRLGAADGAVELEEHEHAIAFASLPAGSAGTDRFLQRVQTGGTGGLGLEPAARQGVGIAAQTEARRGVLGAQAPCAGRADTDAFLEQGKPDLIKATETMINDLARSRVGEVLAPTEARVVDRPAPRFTFPTEPMIALRSAGRSLRHGHDGRGSTDGKLSCRWPTHVIDEIDGVIAKTASSARWATARCPRKADAGARGAAARSVSRRVDRLRAGAAGCRPQRAADAPEGRVDCCASAATAVTTAALRYSTRCTRKRFTTRACRSAGVRPGVQEQQALVSDELRKFSLYKGADPDLVGVTTWAQPWVPIMGRMGNRHRGLDPPALQAWQLGAVDLDGTATTFDGATATLRGRSQLTGGGPRTLHDAITDWLAAEDALDKDHAGQVDEALEDAYRTLDSAVKNLDVLTATLDGRAPSCSACRCATACTGPAPPGVSNPAPIAPPHLLLAGCATLSARARARRLRPHAGAAGGRHHHADARVDRRSARRAAAAPAPAAPGALAVPPRRCGHARGRRRHGARVDQVEASLQVNPVAGFVMPDHLDEEPRGIRRRRRAHRRAAARAGERRRDVGDRRRPRRPGRCRPAAWPRAGAEAAGGFRRGPGGSRCGGGAAPKGEDSEAERALRCCAPSTPRCGRWTASPRWAARARGRAGGPAHRGGARAAAPRVAPRWTST